MHVNPGHLTFTPRFDLDAPLAQLRLVLADAIQGCDALDRQACESVLSGLVGIHRLTPALKNLKAANYHAHTNDETRLVLAAHAKFETLVHTLHCDREADRARNAGKDVSNV